MVLPVNLPVLQQNKLELLQISFCTYDLILLKYGCIYRHFLLTQLFTIFNQFASTPCKILPIDNRRTFKHAFRFLCMWPGDLLTRHAWRAIMACHHGVPSWRAIMACHHGAPSWRLTCIHAIVSRSPWGHGSVAPDRRHCKQ